VFSLCCDLLREGFLNLKTLICLWSVWIPVGSWAYSDFVPLRERAQGHSLTGALQANESIYSNPAGTSFSQIYSLDGTYASPKSFSASVVDTQTNSLGGGIGYFKDQSLDGKNYLQGFRLTMGSRISQNWGFGLAGKALWGNGATKEVSLKDLDSGFLWNGGFASGGIVFRNFFGGNKELGQDREISLGGRIGYSNTIFLSVSTHSKWGSVMPYEIGFGAEYVSPWYFSLMGGYRFQRGLATANPSCWSMGASFLSPRLSLHYAVEFPQSSTEESSHILGTTLAF